LLKSSIARELYIRDMKSIQKTQWHVIAAHLWRLGTWQSTFQLQGVPTDFGFIGSSREQRVRELAVNAPCIPSELRDKIEKKRGSEIGLKPAKCEFFRYIPRNERMCRRFDAGLPADQVFAV